MTRTLGRGGVPTACPRRSSSGRSVVLERLPLRRRRDRARRRLRLGQRHAASARPAAARARRGGGLVRVDGRARARGARSRTRTTVFQADLAELELDEQVDAAFSNAVFHWIPDHDALFTHLHAALRPGGRLVAQCGGEGNVARLHAAAREVGAGGARTRSTWRAGPGHGTSPAPRRPPSGSSGPASPRSTTWLEPYPVTPEDPLAFLTTVCLGPTSSASRRSSRPATPTRCASGPGPSSTTSGSTSTQKSPARAQETVQYRTFVRFARLHVDAGLTRGDISPMAGVPVRVLVADNEQLVRPGRPPRWIRGGRIRARRRGRGRRCARPSWPTPSVPTWRWCTPGAGRGDDAVRAILAASPGHARAGAHSSGSDHEAVVAMLRAGAGGYVMRDAPARSDGGSARRGGRRHRLQRRGRAARCSRAGGAGARGEPRPRGADHQARPDQARDRRTESSTSSSSRSWRSTRATVVGYEALSRFSGGAAPRAREWFAEAHEVGLGPELELAAIRLACERSHTIPRACSWL